VRASEWNDLWRVSLSSGSLATSNLAPSVLSAWLDFSPLFSFDFSSDTDSFPRSYYRSFIGSQRLRVVLAFMYSLFSLLAETSCDYRRLDSSHLSRFAPGLPLGFLDSWPLFFAITSIIVWYCAVYPNRVFKRYMLSLVMIL